MSGGTEESYRRLGPMLESISAHVDGEPCCAHVGPDGAGHFVKMVHNGIEYADMQLIAEAYDLLRRAAGLDVARIAEVFRSWRDSELDSYLIEFKDKHHLITAPDTERLEIRCRLVAVLLHVGKREVKVFTPVVRPAQSSLLRSLICPCVDHIVAVIKMFRDRDMKILFKIFL